MANRGKPKKKLNPTRTARTSHHDTAVHNWLLAQGLGRLIQASVEPRPPAAQLSSIMQLLSASTEISLTLEMISRVLRTPIEGVCSVRALKQEVLEKRYGKRGKYDFMLSECPDRLLAEVTKMLLRLVFIQRRNSYTISNARASIVLSAFDLEEKINWTYLVQKSLEQEIRYASKGVSVSEIAAKYLNLLFPNCNSIYRGPYRFGSVVTYARRSRSNGRRPNGSFVRDTQHNDNARFAATQCISRDAQPNENARFAGPQSDASFVKNAELENQDDNEHNDYDKESESSSRPSLLHKLNSITREVQTFESKIKSLEQQLHSYEKEVLKLKDEEKASLSKIKSLEQQLYSSNKEVLKLEQLNKDQQLIIANQNQLMEEMKKTCAFKQQDLEAERHKLLAVHHERAQAIIELRDLVALIPSKVKDATKEFAMLKAENATLRSHLKTLQDRSSSTDTIIQIDSHTFSHFIEGAQKEVISSFEEVSHSFSVCVQDCCNRLEKLTSLNMEILGQGLSSNSSS